MSEIRDGLNIHRLHPDWWTGEGRTPPLLPASDFEPGLCEGDDAVGAFLRLAKHLTGEDPDGGSE